MIVRPISAGAVQQVRRLPVGTLAAYVNDAVIIDVLVNAITYLTGEVEKPKFLALSLSLKCQRSNPRLRPARGLKLWLNACCRLATQT